MRLNIMGNWKRNLLKGLINLWPCRKEIITCFNRFYNQNLQLNDHVLNDLSLYLVFSLIAIKKK